MVVPVIDFSKLDGAERAETMAQIADGCENWGFFQLVNHGISLELLDRVKKVCSESYRLREAAFRVSEPVRTLESLVEEGVRTADWAGPLACFFALRSWAHRAASLSAQAVFIEGRGAVLVEGLSALVDGPVPPLFPLTLRWWADGAASLPTLQPECLRCCFCTGEDIVGRPPLPHHGRPLRGSKAPLNAAGEKFVGHSHWSSNLPPLPPRLH